MKIASTISRYLMGLMFLVFGLNGFFWFFLPPAGLTGPIVLWNTAVMTSHFVWLYSGVQVIVGVLCLLNRYMALALVAAAAVILNIIVLHITMFPAGLPPAILIAILWFLTSWPHRAYFAPLFAQKID